MAWYRGEFVNADAAGLTLMALIHCRWYGRDTSSSSSGPGGFVAKIVGSDFDPNSMASVRSSCRTSSDIGTSGIEAPLAIYRPRQRQRPERMALEDRVEEGDWLGLRAGPDGRVRIPKHQRVQIEHIVHEYFLIGLGGQFDHLDLELRSAMR